MVAGARNQVVHALKNYPPLEPLTTELPLIERPLRACLPEQALVESPYSAEELGESLFAWQPLERLIRDLSGIEGSKDIEVGVDALPEFVDAGLRSDLHRLRKDRNYIVHGKRAPGSVARFLEGVRHAKLALEAAHSNYHQELKEADLVFFHLAHFHGDFATLLWWVKVKDMLSECRSGTFRDFSPPRLRALYSLPLDEQIKHLAPRVDAATRETFGQMQALDRRFNAGKAGMSIQEFADLRRNMANALFTWLGWRTWIIRPGEWNPRVLSPLANGALGNRPSSFERWVLPPAGFDR